MNDLEFATWIKSHKALHSDFARWADNEPEAARRLLAEQFARALSDVPYDAAMEVSQGLVTGRFEPLPQWEFNRGWNLTARHVARLATATQAATHAIPIQSRSMRRPDTYGCVACRDTGLRDVYSWRSVELVASSPELQELLIDLEDEPPPKPVLIGEDGDGERGSLGATLRAILRGAQMVRHEVTPARRAARRLRCQNVICDCHMGETVWREQGKRPEIVVDKSGARRWAETQRYDPNHHCDCAGADVVKHAPKLVEWVRWKMSAESRENYETAFDAFNNS